MRQIKRYTLLEVLAVCAAILVVTNAIVLAMNRFSREYRTLAVNGFQTGAMRVMRHAMYQAINPLPGRMTTDGTVLKYGGKTLLNCHAPNNAVEISVAGAMRRYPLPAGFRAGVELTDDGRTAVLTLTPERKSRGIVGAFRICASAAKGEKK